MKAGARLFIDTHCHLDDPLLSDRLSEVMAAAEKGGISRFIVPGVDPQNWERILSLAKRDGRISAALGVHPMKAEQWDQSVAVVLQKLTADISAIGEIGLDYSDGMPPHDLQQEVFRAQLKIARDAHLPVIIHCRRAFADTLTILAEERIQDFGGVMHAFSGSVEVARSCVSLGLKIGIAGPVTWQNAVRPLLVVTAISLEHLLLETDSPDLSPEPHKGTVNEPAFLLHIARKIAEMKAVPVADVAEITSETAQALFRLKGENSSA